MGDPIIKEIILSGNIFDTTQNPPERIGPNHREILEGYERINVYLKKNGKALGGTGKFYANAPFLPGDAYTSEVYNFRNAQVTNGIIELPNFSSQIIQVSSKTVKEKGLDAILNKLKNIPTEESPNFSNCWQDLYKSII